MPIGELAALATALFWAFTGLFFAEAARRLGALRVNLLRLPLALVFLTLTMLAGGPISPLSTAGAPPTSPPAASSAW